MPYDFARYTSVGIEHVLKKAGFRVIEREKTTNYVQTVFQMWNAYVVQHILPSNEWLRALLTPLVIAPVTLVGLVLGAILPRRREFYHNNVVVAQNGKEAPGR
jgi:hypothetical protein